MHERIQERFRRALPPMALFAAAFALTAEIWRPLPLYGHSSFMDAMRILVLDAAVRAGEFFPRFVPHYYFGHGSLVFNFYAPGPFYLAEAGKLLGASISASIKLAMALSLALSGVFMYLLARDRLSRPASFAAGFFYMLAPYHLVDMLVRHAFGEHVAFAWLPLAAWGVAGCVRNQGGKGERGKRGKGSEPQSHRDAEDTLSSSPKPNAQSPMPITLRFIAGALGVAGLALSHNITAMISMPVLFCWWLYEFFRCRSFKGAARGAVSVATGLALSAFFWLPAFVEKSLVFAKESLTDEFFQYGQHFVYFSQLFSPYWGFGGSRAGRQEDFMSFQIGLAHWLWIGLAAYGLVRALMHDRERATQRGWTDGAAVTFAVFLGGTFMTTGASKPIWDAIPLLAFVQFPWRFLVIAAFGASLAAAYGVDLLAKEKGWRSSAALVAAACLCALAAYGAYLRPEFEIYDKEIKYPIGNRYDIQKDKLTLPERYALSATLLTLDALDASGESGTSRDDYLPRTVLEKPAALRKGWAQVDGGRVENLAKLGLNAYTMRVAMTEEGRVVLNQFFFPGWRAAMDGSAVDVFPDGLTGKVSVFVPEGEHKIEIEFGSTPLRSAANAASLTALALLIGITAFAPLVRRILATGKNGDRRV